MNKPETTIKIKKLVLNHMFNAYYVWPQYFSDHGVLLNASVQILFSEPTLAQFATHLFGGNSECAVWNMFSSVGVP